MSNYIKVIFFLCVLGCGLIFLNLKYYLDAPGNNTQSVNIILERGASEKSLSKDLFNNGILRYPKAFILIKKIFFYRYIMKAGEYKIPPYATIRNIIEIINKGDVVVHKLILPEGITTKEIVNKVLAAKGLVGDVHREFKEGDFIASTFFYTRGEKRMSLLARLYNHKQTVVDELWEGRTDNLPIKTKQEAIILASIIEKETGIASERPRISGVFINRLRKNMRLQADPTVIYAVTLGQYSLTRALTTKDLKMKSPYNTYIYVGLPPTAIGNPGRKAIEAVLNPMITNELYFVANGKYGHNFSSSLAEHNKHVTNYRKTRVKNVK